MDEMIDPVISLFAHRDRYILSRLNAAIRDCNQALEDYEFGKLTQVSYKSYKQNLSVPCASAKADSPTD